MRLQDHTDFTTLHWVKAELDDALSKARQALESYVEDSRDAYVMAGISAVGDLSHAMEALLDAVAGGQRESDRPAIEATETGFDRLHGMSQASPKTHRRRPPAWRC